MPTARPNPLSALIISDTDVVDFCIRAIESTVGVPYCHRTDLVPVACRTLLVRTRH